MMNMMLLARIHLQNESCEEPVINHTKLYSFVCIYLVFLVLLYVQNTDV